MDKAISKLKFKGDGKSKEYEVEAICDSTVYARESKSSHLPGLYYLVSCKGYPEEENTWEPALAVQHLRRLLSTFHKKHLEKPIATSSPVNLAPPTTRPIVKPKAPNNKLKRGQQAKASNNGKPSKKNWALVSPNSRPHEISFRFFFSKVRRLFYQRIQLLSSKPLEVRRLSIIANSRFSSLVLTALEGFLSIIS